MRLLRLVLVVHGTGRRLRPGGAHTGARSMSMTLPRRRATAKAKPARARRPTARAANGWSSGFMSLLAVVVVLNIIGLVMVLSASSVHDLRVYHSAWYSFIRQCIYVLAGAVAMIVALRVDYRWWRRIGPLVLGASLCLLLLVLVPGVGVRVGGSARWLGAGPLQFQPAELGKAALLVFGADVLCRRARFGHG